MMKQLTAWICAFMLVFGPAAGLAEGADALVEAPGSGPATVSDIIMVMDVPMLTLNNGVQMPQFGLGTQIQSLENGDLGILNRTSREAVAAALEAGYRHLDDAHGYLNERGVGQGIVGCGVPREEIWMTDKLWLSEYADAYNAVDRMLERLGISNFDNRMDAFNAIMAQEIKPQVMQLECHPFAQRLETRALAAQYGIQVECWYPLGHGDQWLLNADTLEAIAAAHGKSVVQVILRWHIQEGFSVIPGSTNPDHMRENINIFDLELTNEEMDQIRAMDQGESGRYFSINDDFMGGWFTSPVREWDGGF